MIAYDTCLLYDPTRAHKSGSTLPIKIQLCDASGANVSLPDIVVQAVGVFITSTSASGTLDDSGNSSPDMNFRYSDGQYIFNLSLKGFVTGTYGLQFTAGGNPAPQTIYFQVR